MPARIPTFGLVALLAAVPAVPTRRSSATPTWAAWRTASTATRRSRTVPATTSTCRAPADCGSWALGHLGLGQHHARPGDRDRQLDRPAGEGRARQGRAAGRLAPRRADAGLLLPQRDRRRPVGGRRPAADAPADPQRGPVARRTRPRARRADPRWPRPLGRRGPRPLPGGA